MQLPQQRRKTSQQNPFAHYQRSVTASEYVSWQVKIGLHQFDNYIKIPLNPDENSTRSAEAIFQSNANSTR